MQIMEFAKKEGFFKKSFAAGVVIAPESQEHFLSELSQAGGDLMEWKAQRGDKGKNVMFTIVCEPDFVEEAKAILSSIFELTPEMIALAENTGVSANFIDDKETVLAQIEI